jgi:hypothetical protein
MVDEKSHRMEKAYPAEKARGGEIILRKRWQRAVFIASLGGAVILGIAVALMGR